MKKILPLIIAAIMLAPLFFMHSCANTTEAPTGGAKDTIPPVLTGVYPVQGTVGFPLTGAKIVFTFNEYVTIKNPKSIFLSPPTKYKPQGKLHGKSVVITFKDTLAPNTTYTLNLNDAIVDNNEANPFPGIAYVFSTGEHIDSMMVTGTVRDCNTLEPVKGATVMLYKDHRDSAVFLQRPFAAAMTDEWGYFSVPYLQDTLYRMYAVLDKNADNIYQPETEKIGFVDSLVHPVLFSIDTLPELMKFDMKDTLNCLSRKSQYEINIFKEKPTRQIIVNKARIAARAGYISFMAPYAWIDSLIIKGYPADKIITQFNLTQDSLEFWLNDNRIPPDTLHVSINYRKTDTLGRLKPFFEKFKLTMPEGKTVVKARKKITHEDTTCVFKLTAEPENIEQKGFDLMFKDPIVWESFDQIEFKSINQRQKEAPAKFTVEQDTLNLRHYILHPTDKLMVGYDYYMKIPHRAFRDINGNYSDSTEVTVKLPTDETLSTLRIKASGVEQKYIVELLNDRKTQVMRSYVIEKDTELLFPYLKEGNYAIRITADGNRNSFVDTGSVLEHRQPEKVKFLKVKDKGKDKDFITIQKSFELSQDINFKEMFAD